jgi:hypothetical protein
MSSFSKKLLLAVLVAALGTLAVILPALAHTGGIVGANHNETFLDSLD